jgi:lipoprotein signal peptidase
MTRVTPSRIALIAALLILVVDQITKWWVLEVLNLPALRQVVLLPVLNLTMVWNRGITFGLLSGVGDWGRVILSAISLLVVIALTAWAYRVESRWVAVAIAAIIGGAIGNVIDRLRFGAVVDFIHIHIETRWGDLSWYVFNVADAAIVCGVIGLIIDSQWPDRRPPTPGKGR